VASTNSTGIIWKNSSSGAGMPEKVGGSRLALIAAGPVRKTGQDHCRARAAVTCCSVAKPSSCSHAPIFMVFWVVFWLGPQPAARCASSAARSCAAVSCWRGEKKQSQRNTMRGNCGTVGHGTRPRQNLMERQLQAFCPAIARPVHAHPPRPAPHSPPLASNMDGIAESAHGRELSATDTPCRAPGLQMNAQSSNHGTLTGSSGDTSVTRRQ